MPAEQHIELISKTKQEWIDEIAEFGDLTKRGWRTALLENEENFAVMDRGYSQVFYYAISKKKITRREAIALCDELRIDTRNVME